MVGADRPHQVELAGAADAGDLRSERLGDLHGVAADTARGTDDQHLLSCLQAADVAQSAQCGHPGDRHGSGLLEGEVRGLERELVLARSGELGERALADTEHLVAGLEARDLIADGNHHTRHIEAGNGVLRRAQAGHQSRGVGQTGH